MDLKKRNRIITVLVLFIGLIFIIGVLPILLGLTTHYPTLLFYGVGLGCLYLEEFILMITLFLCIYFIVKPRKTLKGKKNLTKIDLIFGGVIIFFSIIGIGFLLHGFPIWYDLGSLSYVSSIIMEIIIPLLLCFILGIILLIHRYYLRKKIQN